MTVARVVREDTVVTHCMVAVVAGQMGLAVMLVIAVVHGITRCLSNVIRADARLHRK